MIIAVDFDGTIVEHRYPAIGQEKEGAIDTLKLLAREGNKLILFTVRDGELLDQAVEYCRRRGLEFYAVNSNTPQNELLPDGRCLYRRPQPGRSSRLGSDIRDDYETACAKAPQPQEGLF